MTGQLPFFIGILFLVLSTGFLVASIRPGRGGASTVSRKVRLRLAFAFAAVGAGLFLLQVFMQNGGSSG